MAQPTWTELRTKADDSIREIDKLLERLLDEEVYVREVLKCCGEYDEFMNISPPADAFSDTTSTNETNVSSFRSSKEASDYHSSCDGLNFSRPTSASLNTKVQSQLAARKCFFRRSEPSRHQNNQESQSKSERSSLALTTFLAPPRSNSTPSLLRRFRYSELLPMSFTSSRNIRRVLHIPTSDRHERTTDVEDKSGGTQPRIQVIQDPSIFAKFQLTQASFRYQRLQYAMKDAGFNAMRSRQEEELHGFRDLFRKQRNALYSHYFSEHSLRRQAFETHLEERREEHSNTLIRIEERNLEREIELCERQAQESLNCLTALRHMEGYCNNTEEVGEASRTVNEEHRQRLSRQRHEWDRMPRKHEQFIHKLRGELGRSLEKARRKQARELEEMHKRHEQETDELFTFQRAGLEHLENVFKEREEKLEKRWLNETVAWKRKREEAGDAKVPWPIPPMRISLIDM